MGQRKLQQQLRQQIQAQQEATRRWERAATHHATREQDAKQALAAVPGASGADREPPKEKPTLEPPR